MGGNFLLIWDILIPLIMLIYGGKLWLYTPELGASSGFSTKYVSRNKDTWKEGNKFGGKLLIIVGVALGILTVLRRLVLRSSFTWMYFIFMAIELALIFSIVPLINAHVKRKFGITD